MQASAFRSDVPGLSLLGADELRLLYSVGEIGIIDKSGKIRKSVGRFAGGVSQSDDITMLCLHYIGQE